MSMPGESRPMVPRVDMGGCTGCNSCVELCPSVFRHNPDTGWIEVIEADSYPEREVQEAAVICPGKCILWEER